jgi:saccharopine dehydrogenase (NAD+, L-lysine-forming)
MNRLYIRREDIYELRVALVPSDVKRLIERGFQVYVQESENRIYKDSEYSTMGAILTSEAWYHETYKDCLIIGLKELHGLSYLNNHTHIYFSHSFKKQKNSLEILHAFRDSKSKLYDFEYFVNNARIIAFGIYAGQVGCVLGLLQAYHKLNNGTLGPLKPWSSYEEMCSDIPSNTLKIAIIGARGRTGQGVQRVLRGISNFDEFDRLSDYTKLTEYDIIFNCIVLDESYNKVWFDQNSVFTKPTIIVDISCDYSKPNNPIQLYKEPTTWDKPVFHYNKNVDILAIENLPSLLPKESSDYFSDIFRELLLDYPSPVWSNTLDVFLKISQDLAIT